MILFFIEKFSCVIQTNKLIVNGGSRCAHFNHEMDDLIFRVNLHRLNLVSTAA